MHLGISSQYFFKLKIAKFNYNKIRAHELITIHVGRKTFVVESLRRGIPADVIMEWTGHSSRGAMLPYIAIVPGAKKSEMNKFNSPNF